jgi:diguanylate cyclase (GGDEF)-like protein
VGPRLATTRTSSRGGTVIDNLVTVLGVVAPAAVVVGTVAAIAREGVQGTVPADLVVPTMALTFLALVARLVLAALRHPERRIAMLAMAMALVLWAAGSAQVNGATDVSAMEFPAPGELFFAASFLALAAHLFLDVGSWVRASASSWLEAAVASGGAMCVVALLAVTPFADEFARQGVPLVVALVYPAMDAVLLTVVIGQIVLHRRAASLGTGLLVAGFVVLTVADTLGMAINLGQGTYAFGPLLEAAWGAGYILLAASACRPRVEPRPPREDSASAGIVVVAAAAVALGVLTFQPQGAARLYAVVPALLTFLAAGARLVLALRDARGAAEAYRVSRTDDLTGLPNRRAVIGHLAEQMGTDAPVAVALVDLDGFKEINDSLGHGAGDSLLQVIARRLQHALPPDVVAARLGSDEFAVVVAESDVDVVTQIAEDVRRLIRRPILLDGLEVSVDASVGLALRAPEMSSKGDLLRCADVALIDAKRSPAKVRLYDPEQDEYSRSRLALAEELRNGLERGEVVAWYQPQVETDSGRACSVEALVRWKHPTQGLLAPYAFLSVARRAGLMPRLTEIVLAAAVRDLAAWRARGLDVCVAVNVAPPELLSGTVLPVLFGTLAAEGVPADRFVVEVTEDSFLADPDRARTVIAELRAHGVQVSIDDYGTGFSSLAYLRTLPLQELKIDRAFVSTITEDERSSMIVRTTTQLAHGLGLRVVAEGVEDEATWEHLRGLGVDVLQGYLFARPMPGEHIAGWLDQREAGTSAALTSQA